MSGKAKILGAILAGGASRRFGSDKAVALINGRQMLDHVLDALRPQVGAIVVCGRSWPGEVSLADLRSERLGPLAGLEAALHHAERHGYDAVLSAPVDTLPLPSDLVERLRNDCPTVFERQHLIGYWPSGYGSALTAFIAAGGRTMEHWRRGAIARSVPEPSRIENANFLEDLVSLQARLGVD